MNYVRKTAIVVPCYNEEKRLSNERFISYITSHPLIFFIFVNDASTDRTLYKINKIVEEDTDSSAVISLRTNSGKAEAVRQGFKYAFNFGFSRIGYWDADLSTPLAAIEILNNYLDDCRVNVVMGARVRLLGKKILRKATRHYCGRIYATLASLVLNLPVYDTQCGAKIFKNNEVLREVFSAPFKTRWGFDIEVLARLKISSKTMTTFSLIEVIKEIPLEEWIEVKGSKLKFSDYFNSLVDLIRVLKMLIKNGFPPL